MVKHISIAVVGYALILFVLYAINTSDPYQPSSFGKWGLIITPIYIVLVATILFILKKRENDKN